MTERPYSLQTLAHRWGCRSGAIRRMLQDGKISGFRVGRLVRIPFSEVERWESKLTALQGIGAASRLSGTKKDADSAARSARWIAQKPKPESSSSNVHIFSPDNKDGR